VAARKTLPKTRDLSWPATLVVASVLAAWSFAAADAIRRSGWELLPVARHVTGVVALYALVGTVIGLGTWLVIGLERRLTLRVPERRRNLARAGVYALLAGAASASTAFWTFSGQRIQKSALATVLPWVFIACIALGAAVLALAVLRSRAALDRGRRILPAAGAVLALGVAAGLMFVDLTVFVALYSRLHALLEVSAFVLLACVFAIALDRVVRRRGAWAQAIRLVAALGVVWASASALVPPLRAWRDRALRHVWIDPAYAGRALGRVQTVEAFLRNPLAWRGVAESRLETLKQTYDISTTSLAPAWEEPLDEPKAVAQRIAALRGPRRDWNVIVFYVDTLRQDVASDPSIMPHAVEFAKQSLELKRAYAPGSDTLHSLPGITSGSYDKPEKSPGDLLQVAERAKLERVLIIPQSAYEFLNKLRPTFEFDRAIQVSDYRPDKKEVWGYGADQPTSERIVDRALEWIADRKDRRFFLWLFHFDQHNWRELDKDWVHGTAAKYEIPDEGLINWRYRVVAHSIDREFQRLLDGLHQQGLDKDTIVVFVSDHGEGLGRDGFWVHAVFLWDCLVRVPVAIRIPGLGHRVIYDKVSLVDIAPTLARYLVDDPDTREYDGEDLLSYLIADPPKRRHPILLSGVSQENLVRVGIVDPEKDMKLVLPLESGTPELYDLSVSDPDWLSVAEDHPTVVAQLLSQLVRSPIFPRSAEDVDVQAREERAASSAAKR
jgi:hypothetical protein